MTLIHDFADLMSIRRNGDYALACDIDCKGHVIDKILNVFSGTLDGNGHAIKNLVLTANKILSDGQYVALFHEMCRAKIKNLELKNFVIDVPESVYEPDVAVLCVDAGESVFENIKVDLSYLGTGQIPLVYQSYRCNFEVITLSNNMYITNS